MLGTQLSLVGAKLRVVHVKFTAFETYLDLYLSSTSVSYALQSLLGLRLHLTLRNIQTAFPRCEAYMESGVDKASTAFSSMHRTLWQPYALRKNEPYDESSMHNALSRSLATC